MEFVWEGLGLSWKGLGLKLGSRRIRVSFSVRVVGDQGFGKV